MTDNLQTAIDYLNNSVKLLPNNPFKTELTKNSSNDDKFMALCYAMQQTYGLSLTGQMDTPTIRRLEKEGNNISILNGGEYDINRFVGIALTMLGYDIGDPLSKYTSGAVREAVNSHVSKLGAYADMTLWGMPKGHLIAILAGEQADLNSTIGSKNVQNAQRDINHIITNDGEFARLVATDGVFKPYMLHSLTQCLYSVTGIPKENDDFDTVINPAKLISAGYSEFDRRKMWYKLHDLLISALELADVFPMELTSDTDSLYLTDPDIEVGIKAFGTKYNATDYTITDNNVILSLRYAYSLFTHKAMKDNEFVKVPFKIEEGYEIDGLDYVIQAFTPFNDPKKDLPLVLTNDDVLRAKNNRNQIYTTAFDEKTKKLLTSIPLITLQNGASGHTQSLFYADKLKKDKLFVGSVFKQNPIKNHTNWAQGFALIDNHSKMYNNLSELHMLGGFSDNVDDNYRLEACADFMTNPAQFLTIKTELTTGNTTITSYDFTNILNQVNSNENTDIKQIKPLLQYTYRSMGGEDGVFGSLQGFSKLPNIDAMLVSTGKAPDGNKYTDNHFGDKKANNNYGFYLLPFLNSSDKTDAEKMYQAPLIDLLSNNRIQTDIDQYYQSTIADSLNRAQIPKDAYSYQTEIEAINAVDSNHAWIIVSTHIKIDTKDETIKKLIFELFQTAKHKNTSFSTDLNMLYKVSW